MVILIILFSLLIAVGAGFYTYHLIRKKYDNFILQNSACIKQLKEINSRYHFFPYINFDQCHTYDNESFYNNISCEDYLIYQLQYMEKKIFKQIEKVKSNSQQYSKYLDEVNNITHFGQFQVSIGKLKIEKLFKREKILISKKTYKQPTVQFMLKVTLCCSTINGRVYDTKSENFFDKDIQILVKRLRKKNGSYYNDRGIWEAICRVERGKVSNKMRFSIYARDGYKCCKCGVSEKYARLEIDHIIPIAKGGKTTVENLQTLCHRCNVEKGDNVY